jgi:hypothetical protein
MENDNKNINLTSRQLKQKVKIAAMSDLATKLK